jgi:osmoprotectant transport system substrate-binding protein
MAFARALGLAVLATAALGLGACGGGNDVATPPPATTATSPTPAATPIRIGTKDFTEEDILGELYRQALEAKGFAVELKPDVGSSEIIHQALDNGVLDMYPEYVGVLLSEVANVTRRPSSPDAAYKVAKAFEEKRGFTLLAPTPFSDSNALAVKPVYARRAGVRSIEDLQHASPKPRIGAPREFQARFEGLVGLARVYGLRMPRYTVLDFGERYAALNSGRVDVTVVLTTERQLARGRYVVLADPRRLFASGHVAPVISQKALKTHGPRFRAVIDAVSARLTTSAMRRMNGAVDIDKRAPREVAAQFLREQDLL